MRERWCLMTVIKDGREHPVCKLWGLANAEKTAKVLTRGVQKASRDFPGVPLPRFRVMKLSRYLQSCE